MTATTNKELIKLAQISDIHIRGQQRHEEYKKAFDLLFEQLLSNNVNAIICTGDIFHTKTENITPEVITLMVWFFNKLAEIAPTHIILGNHDGNLKNANRQDTISPIIDAINNPFVKLYKKSGNYPLIIQVNNSVIEAGWLNIFSLFDKENYNKVYPVSKKNFFNIALYHGAVNGCYTDGNFQMVDCDTDVSFFEDYDLVMLGDIHKKQFLGYRNTAGFEVEKSLKPWIGYPGSLIQQNYGELEEKGWLLWTLFPVKSELKDWDVEFVKLENKMPFITVPWAGTVDETIKNILLLRNNDVKNNRIRISFEQKISQLERASLIKEIKENKKAEEVTFKDDIKNNFIVDIETENVTISKHSLRSDPVALNKLYIEFVKNNEEKYMLSEEQLKEAAKELERYVEELKTFDEDVARDISWSIKELEFNNLFKYGENNKINFQKLQGIVGVYGDAGTGKSSIIGALMYGLFNITDRKPVNSALIINRKKKEASAKILVNISGTDYVINRTTSKIATKKRQTEDEDKAITSLSLDKLIGDEKNQATSENDVKRQDTDKSIRKLIGSSEDFLMTAFSSQFDINRFIDCGATDRKEILNRFLDLDVFKKFFTLANTNYTEIDIKIQKFKSVNWETEKKKLRDNIEEKQIKINELKNIIFATRKNLDDLNLWLKLNQNLNQKDLALEISLIEKDLDSFLRDNRAIVSLINKLKIEQSETKESLAKLEELVANDNPQILQQSIATLETIKKEFSKLKSSFDIHKLKLENVKKSIHKLTLVPCGETFPDCHFIKDSHLDKKELPDIENIVQKTRESLAGLLESMKKLESEKNEEKLKSYNKNIGIITLLKEKIPSIENQINLSEKNLENNVNNIKIKESNLSDLKNKLNSSNNALFEEKLQEIKKLEKLLASNEIEMQKCFISIGEEKNEILKLENDEKESIELLKKLKIYDSIKDAFSKNGIPAMILQTQLPAINLEINKILTGVCDFNITLQTEINNKNTLDIFIEDKHSKRIIELACGLEKTITAIALRAALISLSNLPKPDLFILDEAFGACDSIGLQKCLQLLVALKEKFKTIILISHIPAIKAIADTILEISSNEEDFKIVYE
jgi:DNA repair exonuclease SbcCD ATPase subunit/DNA repair exonuclease SbcCD nuclease subunit